MKPTFLDRAPRYTRLTRRHVEYACAVEQTNSRYPSTWWLAMTILAAVACAVVWVTR